MKITTLDNRKKILSEWRDKIIKIFKSNKIVASGYVNKDGKVLRIVFKYSDKTKEKMWIRLDDYPHNNKLIIRGIGNRLESGIPVKNAWRFIAQEIKNAIKDGFFLQTL